MLPADDIASLLPSRNIERLAAAIGRQLVEIERLFTLDEASFIEGGRRDSGQYFRRNAGPTRFSFSGGVEQTFAEWGEQLSVVLVADLPAPEGRQRVVRLSATHDALARGLGATCVDVRIWTFREDDVDAPEEARECTVSYALEGGGEIAYCTWLHGDMDADYVLPGELLARDRVASCFSVAQRRVIFAAEAPRG